MIDMLAITDRLSRIIADHVDHRTQAEAAITDWLVKPDAQKILQPIAGSPDEVLQAVPLALACLERDQRLSENDEPAPPPSP